MSGKLNEIVAISLKTNILVIWTAKKTFTKGRLPKKKHLFFIRFINKLSMCR